jgi:hypothetical protein
MYCNDVLMFCNGVLMMTGEKVVSLGRARPCRELQTLKAIRGELRWRIIVGGAYWMLLKWIVMMSIDAVGVGRQLWMQPCEEHQTLRRHQKKSRAECIDKQSDVQAQTTNLKLGGCQPTRIYSSVKRLIGCQPTRIYSSIKRPIGCQPTRIYSTIKRPIGFSESSTRSERCGKV